MGLGYGEGKPERQQARAERAEKVAITAPDVQLALALFAYAQKHGERGIDYADARANEPRVKLAAMAEWLAVEEGEPFSARYRAYAEAHPGEEIDLEDESALGELLEHVLG